jgi:threonine aldolase
VAPVSTRRIELRSDNSVGAAPEILSAIAAADCGGAMAYGGDPWTSRLRQRVATTFEHDDVAVFPVVSGTAANALGLSAMCPPWGSVLCHENAHIVVNEGGATSLFTSAVMRPLEGDDGGRLTEAAIESALARTNWGDPHHSQPAVVSMTQPTERGTVYPLRQLRDVAASARSRGLRVHVDGARLANAIATLGCSPADVTWRAGVDVLSLGATKNGAVSTDAIVCFDPALRDELMFRLKRAGHVASKMRFQSAQLDAYLADGLWLRLAGAANAAMARLVTGLAAIGVVPDDVPAVNIAFLRVAPELADAWAAAGIDFYRMGEDRVRLVTSFRSSPDEIDDALERMTAAVG